MIKIFSDIESLNQFAAIKFAAIAQEAVKARGRFTVALAGGSTPKAFYRLLAGDDFKNEIDWSKVFFFFGDERNVAPDDAESNFRMANENLFEQLNIAEKHIFRWQTELSDARIIADEYAKTLLDFFQNALPQFDLILLGMGGDGHTASLFPFTDALKQTKRIAVENAVEKLETTRLTLTFSVINHARNVMFLVKGADKSDALREVLQGEPQSDKFPTQAVKPEMGELFWLVDAEAAALLKS